MAPDVPVSTLRLACRRCRHSSMLALRSLKLELDPVRTRLGAEFRRTKIAVVFDSVERIASASEMTRDDDRMSWITY